MPRREEWAATRHSLLDRLKDWNDQPSWQEFFQTYGRLIYSVALQAGLSDAEAQDAVQETLICVAKEMPEFHYDPARGSFKSWLMKLTRWRIADQFRKRRPQLPGAQAVEPKTDLLAAVADVAAEQVLEQIWDREWQEHLTGVAIEKLKERISPRQIQIWQMHVLRGWPLPRVMDSLGVTRTQVYMAKHRVSVLLRKEIARLRSKYE